MLFIIYYYFYIQLFNIYYHFYYLLENCFLKIVICLLFLQFFLCYYIDIYLKKACKNYLETFINPIIEQCNFDLKSGQLSCFAISKQVFSFYVFHSQTQSIQNVLSAQLSTASRFYFEYERIHKQNNSSLLL